MIRSLRDVALAACISFMVVLALSYSSLANLLKLKILPTLVAPAFTLPYHTWDWCSYLHLMVDFHGINVGKYTMTMDSMGPWIEDTCCMIVAKSFPGFD